MPLLTEAQLKEVLERLPVDKPKVTVGGTVVNLLATVISSSFTGVDEAERQTLVWKHLSEQLGDEAITRVEFVFTDAPGEEEAAE